MKNYRQLIRELPSKTVVMAVGSFNPPTAVNEMTFKLVKKLVESHNAEHVIYITENKNDLPVDRKIHFLNLMFKGLNFVPLTEGNLVEEIGGLKSRYKNVVVVTSEEKSKLFESMSVVSAPVDSNASKIKSFVTKGDYTSFKAAMPSSLRDIDARRLMNEMRQTYGLELLKEDVRFSIDSLRDKYFKGEIYQIGDIVESAGSQYEIMDRGSNYLVVVDNTGNLHRKWVKDVSLVEAVKKPTGELKKACWKGYTAVGLKTKNGRKVPNCVPESVLNPSDVHKDYTEKSKTLQDLSRNKDVDQKSVQQRRLDLDKEYAKHKLKEEVDESQVCYKGYTSKNMHHCSDLAKAFKLAAIDAADPIAMLNAIKTTDTYLELHNERGDNPSIEQLKTWKYAHIKAQEALQKIGHFDAHQEQWLKDKEALDKMLAPHGLNENLEIGKHSNANLERSYMTYRDFMKVNKVQPGFVKDTRIDQNPIEPNVSQQIDDLEPQWPRHVQTKVGSTLATRDHLRRQKVQYATEEVQIDEISQKTAGSYLDKVTKQELSKHGMQHDMYGKLSKNRQKGVSNAFKRLQVDKEGKPVYHLVTKEEYVDEDAKSLKAQADKHTEKALAANKAGDDEKVRYHQAQVAKIKAKMSKLTEEVDDKDTITFDIPLLIRVLEMTREDVKSDASLHKVVEKLIAIRNKGVLTMDDYKMIAQLKEQYMPMSLSGEIGDEIGNDKIKKVKTLPPKLMPKDDSKRLGGGHRDHTFSAFMEKQKVKTKENADYKFTDLMKHQQTGE